MNARRCRLAVATLAVALVSIVTGGPAQPAAAAVDTFSFETSPGIIRTNIASHVFDVDEVSGLVYAITTSEPTRILAIDPGPADSGPITPTGTVRIVDEVVLDMVRPRSIDVSRDGRTVVASGRAGTYVYERSTLTLLGRFDASVEDVRASPTKPSRYLEAVRPVVYNGDDVIDLANTVDPENGDARVRAQYPSTWGADSDTVIAEVNNRPVKIDVSVNPPVLIAEAPVAPVGATTMSVHGDKLLYGNTLLDLETLEIVDEIDASIEPATGDTGGVFSVRSRELPGAVPEDGYVYDATDVSEPTHEWTFPFPREIAEIGTLPDGRVVANEFDGGHPRYLSIIDPARIDSPYGEFHPVQPARVLDTRDGTGRSGAVGKLGGGQEITVQLAGEADLPSTGMLAAVLNVTVTAPTEASFFSIWPSGPTRPEVSNLNFKAGQSIANFVTVAVAEDGSIRLSNEFGRAHAILDVVGYYASESGTPGARYTPVDSQRLLDTRPANGGSGPVRAGGTVTVDVGGIATPAVAGVSQEAVAVVLNVTAVRANDAGYVTVWPSGTSRPVVSSLNFARGDIRANLVVVGLGDDESVTLYTSGSTHLLVDVFGVYEQPDAPRLDQQGKFLPIEPFRSFDSRESSPFDPPGRITENHSLINNNYQGWTDIWNVTAVRPTADGFISVLPYDPDNPSTDFPSTSNVNFFAGEIVANAVYAFGGPLTEVYNPFGETHLVIDRFGYLTPAIQRPAHELWDQS